MKQTWTYRLLGRRKVLGTVQGSFRLASAAALARLPRGSVVVLRKVGT